MKDAAKRIQVDLGELAFALQTNLPEGFYYLDLQTGEVGLFWDGMDIPDEVDEDEDLEARYSDPDRYRKIPSSWSSDSYRLMESFVETLPAGGGRETLEEALQGRKPFRRFKDALLDLGDLRDRWFAFENEAFKQKAREWLAEEDIEADLV